ncbi:MAG: Rieske 2Fe-2S domain-containing protein [Firmicutes bacterium]|nr:Rieske 2Fe-2S domain-containing protein [Bacillota bacterium]
MATNPDLTELLGSVHANLERGLLPAEVFADPAIYEEEMERIFQRAWVFLAHDSEIPEPGDFVRRRIGEDSFIVARDEARRVRVFFNACRHRGVPICESDRGRATHFRCQYHGWTFRNDGRLVGAPAWAKAYRGLNREEWGLLEADQVAEVHGLWFACLDPTAPSLDEWLGDMRWYLDLVFGAFPEGWEVWGDPHRWVIRCNWKIPAENFGTDDYHLLWLHRSNEQIGYFQVPLEYNMEGYHVQAGNGHGLSFSIAPTPDDPGPHYWGYPEELVAMIQRNPRLSPAQQDLANRSRVAVGTVFPNWSFLALPLSPDPKTSEPVGYMTIRIWQPAGPTATEAWSWVLVPRGSSEGYRQTAYRAAMATFSPGGSFEADDVKPWEGVTATAKSRFWLRRGRFYNYQMGLSEDMSSARLVSDWPGPGVVYSPRYEENQQRGFYRRWLELMQR